MSRIDDPTRLRHMQDSAIEAMSFVENCTRKDLDSDRMLTLALVKDIEIIGEAAGRVSADCKAKYPQVPWLQMIGMRNRLTHAYFEIDLDIVWEVVTNDLPPLVAELEKIIALET
ncbi:DUF86 domain-containing protein [Phormidesmis priestleyi ULC007]|uniref:DUF86 domain-containing protein n=1 Tax=Phormidesmis priestleyi ULC007 TaxID=1920490 RepID=A0A2T1DDP7_9CYAN|nr:DUF86 domain-containing protein [Phormidesmis priestleyi]PSB18609.1 DUF86 domain-containing protein [Phormidesmis priestleyi ULC007]PZO49743.1 MAG: DUF86 domain-containing protein [Phormidesmis priestleyi]